MRSRLIATIWTMASAVLLAEAREATAADLTVAVSGATGSGPVQVAVCSSGFTRDGCPFGGRAGSRGGSAVVVIPNIPPGTYGVAAFQDTNGDGQLNRDGAGLPLEPYGFSNGVGRTAPPRFARAAFPVTENRSVGIVLNPPPR